MTFGATLFLLALVGVPTFLVGGAWAYTRAERQPRVDLGSIDVDAVIAGLKAASEAAHAASVTIAQVVANTHVQGTVIALTANRVFQMTAGSSFAVATPDEHRVSWESEAGRQMDEIDRIIAGSA